jgi:peroxiredoxin
MLGAMSGAFARRGRVRARAIRLGLAPLLVVGLTLAAPTGAVADDLDHLLRALRLIPIAGERPAAFVLPMVNGGKLGLADLRGRVILVYFWATWCPYCRKELPAGVERISRERRAQPFTVLAVNIQEPGDLVASWAKGAGVTVPILLDHDGAVARNYRVTATPTTYLIGRDGRLVARASGTREWDGPDGRALLDALIAAPPK